MRPGVLGSSAACVGLSEALRTVAVPALITVFGRPLVLALHAARRLLCLRPFFLCQPCVAPAG